MLGCYRTPRAREVPRTHLSKKYKPLLAALAKPWSTRTGHRTCPRKPPYAGATNYLGGQDSQPRLRETHGGGVCVSIVCSPIGLASTKGRHINTDCSCESFSAPRLTYANNRTLYYLLRP